MSNKRLASFQSMAASVRNYPLTPFFFWMAIFLGTAALVGVISQNSLIGVGVLAVMFIVSLVVSKFRDTSEEMHRTLKDELTSLPRREPPKERASVPALFH